MQKSCSEAQKGENLQAREINLVLFTHCGFLPPESNTVIS